MAKVTQASQDQHPTPSIPPRLMEEAVRVFLALGITAADLRLRATPGSALVDMAEVMDSSAGAS